jgi:hypothetical protein
MAEMYTDPFRVYKGQLLDDKGKRNLFLISLGTIPNFKYRYKPQILNFMISRPIRNARKLDLKPGYQVFLNNVNFQIN